MFASLCLPMACKRSRYVVDSDEEDMVAAMIAYADYTERCKLVCESVQRQCEEALNCYVKLRGGLSNGFPCWRLVFVACMKWVFGLNALVKHSPCC